MLPITSPVVPTYSPPPVIPIQFPKESGLFSTIELAHKAKKFDTTKVRVVTTPQPQPFLPIYQRIFSQDTLRALYVELDPGVDDAAALLQLAAASFGGINPVINKTVTLEGVVPCVGNAVLSQTELNARRLLQLAGCQNVPVYSGAIAPLAIENNSTAIDEMNKNINATHFYGHDGLSDVGGWPEVSIPMQKESGYQFAANKILQASPDRPITLISTSALTELSKTLNYLVAQNANSFAKNINAITIMGGCLDPKAGCNAPFTVPDSQKNSEANFYFDSDAAKQVFAICQKYSIPILLAPLDLTQQPGLLWGAEQTNYLRSLNIGLATQMAKVDAPVPYLDAPCFPNGTYPMHDLFATASILRPDLFEVTPLAVQIGDVGQIIEDSTVPIAKRTVFALSMPKRNQPSFYETMLSQYKRFDLGTNLSTIIEATAAVAGSILLALAGGFICCRKKCKKTTAPSEQDTLIN